MTILLLVLASIALCLSLVAMSWSWRAVTTARSALRELTLKIESPAMRSLTQLDTALTEYESSLSSLSATVRRLSSRIGMSDLRERRKGEQLPSNFDSLSPSERKTVLRRKLADGSMRAIKDDGNQHEVT